MANAAAIIEAFRVREAVQEILDGPAADHDEFRHIGWLRNRLREKDARLDVEK